MYMYVCMYDERLNQSANSRKTPGFLLILSIYSIQI